MTTEYSTLEVTADSVIIIRDSALLQNDEAAHALIDAVRAEFPDNLIVLLDNDTAWEALPKAALRGMLLDLLEHDEARRQGP